MTALRRGERKEIIKRLLRLLSTKKRKKKRRSRDSGTDETRELFEKLGMKAQDNLSRSQITVLEKQLRDMMGSGSEDAVSSSDESDVRHRRVVKQSESHMRPASSPSPSLLGPGGVPQRCRTCNDIVKPNIKWCANCIYAMKTIRQIRNMIQVNPSAMKKKQIFTELEKHGIKGDTIHRKCMCEMCSLIGCNREVCAFAHDDNELYLGKCLTEYRIKYNKGLNPSDRVKAPRSNTSSDLLAHHRAQAGLYKTTSKPIPKQSAPNSWSTPRPASLMSKHEPPIKIDPHFSLFSKEHAAMVDRIIQKLGKARNFPQLVSRGARG